MKMKEQNAWLAVAGFLGAALLVVGGYFISELLKVRQNETALTILLMIALAFLGSLVAIYRKVFRHVSKSKK